MGGAVCAVSPKKNRIQVTKNSSSVVETKKGNRTVDLDSVLETSDIPRDAKVSVSFTKAWKSIQGILVTGRLWEKTALLIKN